MFKFVKKKQEVAIFKHSKNNYVNASSESYDEELFGANTYVENTGIDANLAHLYSLTSFPRTKTNMKDTLKQAYVATKLKDYAFVPVQVSDKILNQVREEQDVVDTYFELQKTKGSAPTYRMRVSAYQTYQTAEIAASMQKSGFKRNDVVNFNNELIKFARYELKNENTSASAHAFLQFITDVNDLYQIANNFADPGSLLEQYANFADIPVPALALHAIISNGILKFNKDGSVNKIEFKKLYKRFEGDKLQNMVCEICGLALDGNKAVPYSNPDYPARTRLFANILPTIARFIKQFTKNFEISAIYSNDEFKSAILNLETQCESYIVDALKQKNGIPTSVSSKLRADAEAFVQELDKENIRLGKRKNADYLINKNQATIIELAIKQLANSANIDIVKAIIDYYTDQVADLNLEVNNILNELNLTDSEKAIVTKYFSKQFRPAKMINCLDEHPHDFAVIANNTALIAKKQLALKIKVAKEFVQRGGEGIDAYAQNILYEQIYNARFKQIEELISFNTNILKLVQIKEDLRVWNYTMGQIKFEGLSAVQDVYDKRKREIMHLKHDNVKDYKDIIKKANGVISEQNIELNKNYAERADLIKEFYADRFDKKLRGYLKSLNLGGNTKGLPADQIKAQIEASKKKILGTVIVSRTDKSEVDLNKIEETFISEIYRIAKGDVKYRNREKTPEALKADLESLKKDLIEDLSSGKGSAYGIILGIRNELSPENNKKDAILINISNKNQEIEARLETINSQSGVTNKNQSRIDDYESDTESRLEQLEAESSVVISNIRRVELIRDYENVLRHLLDAENSAEADFINAAVPDGISKLETKAYVKDREVYKNEINEMLNSGQKELKHLEDVAQNEYNLKLVLTQNEQGATHVDFQLISDPRAKLNNALKPEPVKEEPQPVVVEKQINNETSEQDFVNAFFGVCVVNEILDAKTNPQRKEELAKLIGIDTLFRKSENYLEAAREYLEWFKQNENNLAYELILGKGEITSQQKRDFINACVELYVSQLVDVQKEELPEIRKDVKHKITYFVNRCVLLNKEDDEPEEEDEDFYDDEEEDLGDGEKVVKNDYELNNCHLAKNLLTTLLRRLVRQLRVFKGKDVKQQEPLQTVQQNQVVSAVEEPEQVEPTEPENFNDFNLVEEPETEAEMLDESEDEEELLEQGLINEEELLNDSNGENNQSLFEALNFDLPGVTDNPENEQKYADNNFQFDIGEIQSAESEQQVEPEQPASEQPAVQAEPAANLIDYSNDPLLHKAYYDMLFGQVVHTISGISKEETAQLFAELDVEFQVETLLGKSNREIVSIIENRGISLEKQRKAFALQLSAVVKNNIVDGVLINANGAKVEERLNLRIIEGDPRFAGEIVDSASGNKIQKFLLRSLIIYAHGLELVAPEVVKQYCREMGNLLQTNFYQITEENVLNLTNGTIRTSQKSLIADILEDIKGKII